MKTIRQDLADRLGLLNIRYAVAFCTIATPEDPSYARLTEQLEIGLEEEVAEDVARVRAIVDPADLDDPHFWATPLGRRLFAAGGFTEESLTRTAAALVLDCSRQWVHELVGKGVLRAAPSRTPIDREVYAEQVRNVLKGRLSAPPKVDKTVK